MNWLEYPYAEGEPAENMAVDEALLWNANEIGAPVLRIYGWRQPAATFGYGQRFASVRRQCPDVPTLIRRCTGGGVVDHRADWTYSVIFPASHPWHRVKACESYRSIHAWLKDAFHGLGWETSLNRGANPVESTCRPDAVKNGAESDRSSKASTAWQPAQEFDGSCCFIGAEQDDVLWKGIKIAGAAQRRTRSGLLIQGSVQHPELPLDWRMKWREALLEAAARNWGAQWRELDRSKSLLEMARRLQKDKYETDAYNRKR